jgi:integrase
VLNAMYEFLKVPSGAMPMPLVRLNPVRRVRKSASRIQMQTDRHLPLDAIQAMHGYVQVSIDGATAQGDVPGAMKFERRLWLFTLLFGLWGRRQELCNLCFGDFIQQQHDASWRVTLHRKGGKEQQLPVPEWVMRNLLRYRHCIGLSSTWIPNDSTPAISPIKSSGRAGISPETMYAEIRALAAETASELLAGRLIETLTPERGEMLAGLLVRCSPHWFRHSGPTIAINTGVMSMGNASKMLGHASQATTYQMYYHADDNETRSALDGLGDVFCKAIV